MVRWPRRRGTGAAAQPAGPVPPDPDSSAGQAMRRPAWPWLPRLRTTISSRAPVTADLVLEPSAVRSTWLPRPPASLRVPRGLVGRAPIVSVVPMPAALAELVFPAPPVMPLQPIRRAAAVRAWHPIERQPLTEGRGEYVGEPRVPTVVPAAPEVEPGQIVDPLGLLKMGVAQLAPSTPVTVPTPIAAPAVEIEPDRPRVLRRATLAESRRRGLTVPTAAPAMETSVETSVGPSAETSVGPSVETSVESSPDQPTAAADQPPPADAPPTGQPGRPFAPQLARQKPRTVDPSERIPPALPTKPTPASQAEPTPVSRPASPPSPVERPEPASPPSPVEPTAPASPALPVEPSAPTPPASRVEPSAPTSPASRVDLSEPVPLSPAPLSSPGTAEEPKSAPPAVAAARPQSRDEPRTTAAPSPPEDSDRPIGRRHRRLPLVRPAAPPDEPVPAPPNVPASTGEPARVTAESTAAHGIRRVQRAPVDRLPVVAAPRRPVVDRTTTQRPAPERIMGVPGDVAESVRRVQGVDVSDTVVRSGTAVRDRAGLLGARAYTEAGEVFTTEDVDTAAGTAVLAHELVHVAQQREFGADLPAEQTEAGRGLEAEARAVEDWFLGGPQPQQPLRHVRPVPLVAPPVPTLGSAPLPPEAQPEPEPRFDSSPAAAPLPAPISWTVAGGFSRPPDVTDGEETIGYDIVTPAEPVPQTTIPADTEAEVQPTPTVGIGPGTPYPDYDEPPSTRPAPQARRPGPTTAGGGTPEPVRPRRIETVDSTTGPRATPTTDVGSASPHPDRPVTRPSAGGDTSESTLPPTTPADVEAARPTSAPGAPDPVIEAPQLKPRTPAPALHVAPRPPAPPIVDQPVSWSSPGPIGDRIGMPAATHVQRRMPQPPPVLTAPATQPAAAPPAAAPRWRIRSAPRQPPLQPPVETSTAPPERFVALPTVGPEPTSAPGLVQRAPLAVADDQPNPPTEAEPFDSISDRIGDTPPRSWVDIDNTEHLDQLATKLYDRLHDRLRRDVLVQRERSGFLMDTW